MRRGAAARGKRGGAVAEHVDEQPSMTSRPLRRVRDLPPALREHLERHGFVQCGQLLDHHPFDFYHLSNLSLADSRTALAVVSRVVCPAPTTAFRLRSSASGFVPSSLEHLDRALGGGIPARSLTELVGQWGLGKTQFALTLAATTAAQPAGVLYIDTELSLRAQRLAEIIRVRFGESRVIPTLDKIQVQTAATPRALRELLDGIEETIIKHGIKLVIVDSIAAVVRRDTSLSGPERQEFLVGLASVLKRLAESYVLAVVVTNHITMGDQQQARHAFEQRPDAHDAPEQLQMTPALGRLWAHSANTRLVLENDGANGRRIRVAKSPMSPVIAVPYAIDAEGIVPRGAPVTLQATDAAATLPNAHPDGGGQIPASASQKSNKDGGNDDDDDDRSSKRPRWMLYEPSQMLSQAYADPMDDGDL